jgi:WD40 repeat protein
MQFKGPIGLYPLQVYVTALVFSPTGSAVKRIFRDEEPPWLKNKVAAQDEWDPCLQTLEGHQNSVRSVAFSHDSKMIASESSDFTIKLWDTGTPVVDDVSTRFSVIPMRSTLSRGHPTPSVSFRHPTIKPSKSGRLRLVGNVYRRLKVMPVQSTRSPGHMTLDTSRQHRVTLQ